MDSDTDSEGFDWHNNGYYSGQSANQQHGADQASSSTAPSSKVISHFVGMGFLKEDVLNAIDAHGEEDQGAILDTLLQKRDMKKSPSDLSSDESLEDFLASFSDEDTPTNEEHGGHQTLEEKTLHELVAVLGYSPDDAAMAMERCGPGAPIWEIIDSICAAQVANGILSDEQPQNVCVRDRRKLKEQNSSEATGPPYFYYENVTRAPDGVWHKISSYLYGIEPEHINSKQFSAASRQRGYIHNLPRTNRVKLQPIPPQIIFEALPHTRTWWPSWDKRTKLNCLVTREAGMTVTNKIRKDLENCGSMPSPELQNEILKKCRTWNLVWIAKDTAVALTFNEIELLLGFPNDHTRGWGISNNERLKGLGNSFQIDTVAYHLSVLKEMYPNGITVLSLFSGIGGAEVALHRLGIRLKNVVSVEIEESSRSILQNWWHSTYQQGELIEIHDVKTLSSNKLKKLIDKLCGFDLIIGGSPCNNLSGNNRVSRVGLDGEQSSLFYEYHRILVTVKAIMASRVSH